MPRTLWDLPRTLKPQAGPRLLRLRFVRGSRIQTMTALCGRSDDVGDRAVLILAFLGPEAERIGQSCPWLTEAGGSPAPWPEAALPAATSPSFTDCVEAGPRDDAPSDLDHALEGSRAALRSVLGGAPICRFAWRTDASGALRQIDGPLMDRLGLPLSLADAGSLAGQIARFDPEAAKRLDAAIADRTTWGGLSAFCPVLDGSVALPVGFAASPQFDAARQFQGFRGSSRFDVAHLRRRDPPEPVGRPEDRPFEGVPPPKAADREPSPTSDAGVDFASAHEQHCRSAVRQRRYASSR